MKFFLPVKDDERLMDAPSKSALFSDTFLFGYQRQTQMCNVLAKHFIGLHLRQSQAASKNQPTLMTST